MNVTDKKKQRQKTIKKRILGIVLLSFLYLILGSYSVTQIPNPFLNGFPIAFNMVVIVFAGIIWGRYTGMSVGILGAFFGIYFGLVLKPESSSFLYSVANIIPHAIMGYAAGMMSRKYNVFFGSLSIVIGHTLNIIFFIQMGLFQVSQINDVFWNSILYETIIDIIAINMICMLFLISFPFIKKKW